MTRNDWRLWSTLVLEALKLQGRFGGYCPRGLRRAGQACQGSRKKRAAGAAMPEDMRFAKSSYAQLGRLSQQVDHIDQLWRQLVLDHAHAVKADMVRRGAWVEGKEVAPPVGFAATLPMNGEGQGVQRKFRADIDG